jgi:hypothetical protein
VEKGNAVLFDWKVLKLVSEQGIQERIHLYKTSYAEAMANLYNSGRLPIRSEILVAELQEYALARQAYLE